MNKVNKGGDAAAYFHEVDKRGYRSTGLSKLDYFAAHAPDVPEWFDPDFKHAIDKPKKPNPKNFGYPIKVEAHISSWLEDPCFDLAGSYPGYDLTEFEKLSNQYWKDLENWTIQRNLLRLTHWRYSYAAAMVEMRQNL